MLHGPLSLLASVGSFYTENGASTDWLDVQNSHQWGMMKYVSRDCERIEYVRRAVGRSSALYHICFYDQTPLLRVRMCSSKRYFKHTQLYRWLARYDRPVPAILMNIKDHSKGARTGVIFLTQPPKKVPRAKVQHNVYEKCIKYWVLSSAFSTIDIFLFGTEVKKAVMSNCQSACSSAQNRIWL